MNLNTLILKNSKLLSALNSKLISRNIDDFIHHSISGLNKNFIIGLDIGKLKCGTAVSDESLRVAIPIQIVSTILLSGYLDNLSKSLGHFGLVIGCPINLMNEFGRSAYYICEIVDKISETINSNNIPIWFHDERYSTINSKSMLKAPLKYNLVDDLCAMSILQEFLDTNRFKIQNARANGSN
jgi:RNase H-fold protein (predicted Holliday junction resolvase)